MNDIVKGTLIGVVTGLITSGIVYATTEKLVWNVSLPLWIWLVISSGLALLFFIVFALIRDYRIYDLVSVITEDRFDNPFEYIWKFKRSRHGYYRTYGDESTNIHTKKPLVDLNNERVVTIGHDVLDETNKMILQLWQIASMNEKMGERLKPVLEYLNWV